MELDIGINKAERQAIASGLSRLLADSYSLYLKTHNYHWNVTGPMFNTLHLMFETQYTELATAVDEIAERIRALRIKAPESYSDFSKLTNIAEGTGNESAEEARDEPSADLLTQRMQLHEKNVWMLRSMLV